MKVLMVHNRYRQRGGEDAVAEAETHLLGAHGVEVERLDVDNDAIHGLGGKIHASIGLFAGSSAVNDRVSKALAGFNPDVVHVHNWFPTLSASIFNKCRRAGVPAVHTLHNYRLLCAGATLFRDGRVCEDCVGTALRMPGVMHGCYRGSTTGTAVATAGMLTHWATGTWHRSVDRFIALSEFARTKLIEGGLPADKITVKQNFVDPAPEPGAGGGGYLLYAGRLTEEKGLRVLLECWKSGPNLPVLRIAGTGPLEAEVRAAALALPNVEWVGGKSSAETVELMRHAKALLCPSLWYEGMPRVTIESLAVGTPVVASRIGCYPEMIVDGESGVLFPAGDVSGLLSRLRGLEVRDGYSEMRTAARRRFEQEYTGARNIALLLQIYRGVMAAERQVYPVAVSA